jgi:DNA-binding response OmpR family regulator
MSPEPAVAVRRVLVVDDDLALRTLFVALLERNGFVVDLATDGMTGFDRISRYDYAVILLDLMMPGVSGFELLARLSDHNPGVLSRVIIMTGATRRTIQVLDIAQVWGLIRKPFDIDELVASVMACSEGRPRSLQPVSRAPKRIS